MKINMDKITEIISEIKTLDQKILCGDSTLGFAEKEIQYAVQQIGQYLMQELSQSISQTFCPSKVFDANGFCYKYIKHVNKTMKTVFNNGIQISRAYYYNSEIKSGYIPYDKVIGIEGLKGLTPVLTYLTSYYAGECPYGKSKKLLEKTLNVKVSASCIQKNAEAVGTSVEKEEFDLISSSYQQKCDRIYISIDGTGVPTVEGECREAKTVVVEQIRGGEVKKYYSSKISKIEEFKFFLGKLSGLIGVDHCETTVILGDGAAWIDGIKKDLFPFGIRIIDFYHAVEYIYKGCDIIYGKGSILGKEKAEELTLMLREGEVYEVIDQLKAFAKRIKNQAELKKVIGYFENHKENMDYENYEIYNGYKIGSGVVEGACKYIVSVRFKRNGMRWTVKDANSILALIPSKVYIPILVD